MRVVRIGLVLGVLIVAGCSREPAPEGTATVPWAPSTTFGPSTVMSVVESTLPASTVAVVPTLVESADEAEIRRVVEESFRAELAAKFAGKDGPSGARDFYTKALNDELDAQLIERQSLNQRYSAGTVNIIIGININVKTDLASATVCLKNDIQVWDTLGTADESDDVLTDGTLGVLSTDMFLEKEGGKWLIYRYDDSQINPSFCDGAL
jgi:hypothetical protein